MASSSRSRENQSKAFETRKVCIFLKNILLLTDALHACLCLSHRLRLLIFLLPVSRIVTSSLFIEFLKYLKSHLFWISQYSGLFSLIDTHTVIRFCDCETKPWIEQEMPNDLYLKKTPVQYMCMNQVSTKHPANKTSTYITEQLGSD